MCIERIAVIVLVCMITLLQSSLCSARLLGFQHLLDNNCLGTEIASWPWSEDGQCSEISSRSSIQFDCPNERVFSCTSQQQWASFACREYQDHADRKFAISYSCEEHDDSDLFLYTYGAGSCGARTQTVLRVVLQLNRCQAELTGARFPEHSYRIDKAGDNNTFTITQFWGNGFCESHGHTYATVKLDEGCSSSETLYHTLERLSGNDATLSGVTLFISIFWLMLMVYTVL